MTLYAQYLEIKSYIEILRDLEESNSKLVQFSNVIGTRLTALLAMAIIKLKR